MGCHAGAQAIHHPKRPERLRDGNSGTSAPVFEASWRSLHRAGAPNPRTDERTRRLRPKHLQEQRDGTGGSSRRVRNSATAPDVAQMGSNHAQGWAGRVVNNRLLTHPRSGNAATIPHFSRRASRLGSTRARPAEALEHDQLHGRNDGRGRLRRTWSDGVWTPFGCHATTV